MRCEKWSKKCFSNQNSLNYNIEKVDDYLIWSLNSISDNQYLKLNKMIYVDLSSKVSNWIAYTKRYLISFIKSL